MIDRKTYKIRNIWYGMKHRCLDISNTRYGGRGIQICERWLYSFQNFYDDVESTWFPDATIDRIDNDGDYCPENCQWLSSQENTAKRNNERLNDGSHNFLDSDFQRNVQKVRLSKGTHNLQGKENNRKMLELGIHPFTQQKNIEKTRERTITSNRKKVSEGSHPFQIKGSMTVYDKFTKCFIRIDKSSYQQEKSVRYLTIRSYNAILKKGEMT